MKQSDSKIKRSASPRWVIGGGVLALLVLVLVASNSPWVHARLAAAKLLPQPEAYTELYFTQHLALPKTAIGLVPFSFTVHNVEGDATTYPYEVVLLLPNGKTQTLSTGTLALQNGETRSVAATVNVPKGTTTAEIAVVLPNQQESIHFWLGAQS